MSGQRRARRIDLVNARKAAGWTQETLAEEMNVDRLTVHRWEAGDHEPQPFLRPKLAKCLKVSRERLAELLASATESKTSRITARPEVVHGIASGMTAGAVGGAHIRHPMDDRLMTKIDEGVYLSGQDNAPVWLPTFYIDVYPVTNVEYARFVAVTGHAPPQHWIDGRHPEHQSDHPVVFVTWIDATAYAAWAGKSLPTGQQWEKAARGTSGNVYPWGNQRTSAKCNVRENGVGSTTAVDCYQSGVSPYGVFDMCGNVWEWCSTETKSGRHELKGGAWTSHFLRATPGLFNDAAETMFDDDTGFRCAMAVDADA